MKRAFLGAALALLASFAASAQESYRTTGTCDGLPRIAVRTPDGLCVGLLASRMGYARNVLVMANGDLLVVDMSNWAENRGRIVRLRRDANGQVAEATVLLQRLDRPHGIAHAPGGEVYVGLVGSIVAFAPDAPDPAASVRTVATGLPTTGAHPLAQFAVDREGALFVNLGSATDRCDPPHGRPAGAPLCSEGESRAMIKRIVPGVVAIDARSVPPYATGLRNSMALAVYPSSGLLLQGENAYDLPDRDLPHDEINVIREGVHYGWPYCFDAQRRTAEFPGYDCSRTAAPHLLLPAHSAPLAALYVPAGTVPGIAGEALVVTLHGARDHGHRIVAFAIDGDGAPREPMVEVVSGWAAQRGVRPRGAPVGLALDADGAILVTEDQNGTLLRIARER